MTSIHSDRTEDGRRRVRKGTKSCWACKKRKIRCTFPSAGGPCLRCRQHGTHCLLQNVNDSDEVPQDSRSVGDRLGRIERLLEVIVQRDPESGLAPPTDRGQESFATDHQQQGAAEDDRLVGLRPRSSLFPGPDDDRQRLLAAWPPKRYLNLLLGNATQSKTRKEIVPYGIMRFQPPQKVSSTAKLSFHELVHPPEPRLHTVLMARRLLLLALFLQAIPAEEARRLFGGEFHMSDVALDAVRTCSQVVNNNDDYAGSIEHVECLMLESLFWNTDGNFHRAYLALHRALAASRILGLDQGVNVTASVSLDVTTAERIDSSYMWFRMVQNDRYITLMLGLPSITAETPFDKAGPGVNGIDPVEHLECSHLVAGGFLMGQGHGEMANVQARREIDKMLQKSASSLPPQWWIVSSLEEGALEDTMARTMIQMVHYHLLQRLYLPCLLYHSDDPSRHSGIATTIQASREILTRFLLYREIVDGYSFCRGVNFLAFLSIFVLCLAHIQNDDQADGEGCLSRVAAGLVTHLRGIDRGTMERVSGVMQKHHACDDESDPTGQIIKVTRHLLDMEAASYTGQLFVITHEPSQSALRDDKVLGFSGTLSEDGSKLEMHIPHVGVVRVEEQRTLEFDVQEDVPTDVPMGNRRYGNTPAIPDQDQNGPASLQALWDPSPRIVEPGSALQHDGDWSIHPSFLMNDDFGQVNE